MDIHFKGKFKSITSFEWNNIPDFVVLTGPNGTGKSQLLELIYNSATVYQRESAQLQILNKQITQNEVTYLKGEWELFNTSEIDMSIIHNHLNALYNNFKNNGLSPHGEIRNYYAGLEVLKKSGKKHHSQVERAEFLKYFPQTVITQEAQLSQKIGEMFYNYRLSEIELLAQKLTDGEITSKIGEKPWKVLREIIKESKLPFNFNDPSTLGFRDSFKLELKNTITDEVINFNDLSSGEKVLISLVFYLYNSQEKKIFPKLLLLDEPDAHLHPTMSQQFINVVKNVLVDEYGVQVIMTTHSPSTVVLAPNDSIYEMSREEPRIRKSPSKNHAVSLLTAGLVYVGEGTKYFLVEDKDDVTFYSYINNQLTINNLIESNIPLVFIPASTKDKSGGRDAVQNWVNKLKDSGLINIIFGLIDADSGNNVSDGIFKIDRYSIENYLIDPLLVYNVLLDRDKNPPINGISLNIGEEYKLKSLPLEKVQLIADTIINIIEPELSAYFPDFDKKTESERMEVEFTNGMKLLYPKWIIYRRGKTILNEICNKLFTSPVVNFTSLFRALKKLNIYPNDLKNKFIELKKAQIQ